MNEIVTERPNLFEPNDYITVCVEVTGKVYPQKLADAVKLALEANEATMSRIVLEDGLAYYEKILASCCKVEMAEENTDWTELVRQNEKNPFAIDKGELVRVFIIPSENKTQMVTMAHHLAGDGKSVIYFIKDIMNALADHPLTYKPLTLLGRNLPKKGLSVAAKLYYCRHKWNHRCFTWQDYYELHNRYWASASSEIRYNTLSAEETRKIIDGAKTIGCSVNSYLVTQFLQKYQKRCEVGIPVSIRQAGNESMSNLTSGISVNFQYDTKKTFAENARRIDKRIKRAIKQYQFFVLQFLAKLPVTLIDAVLLQTHGLYADPLAERAARVMGYSGKKRRNLGVTNLTVLDIPTSYGDYEISDIIFVPPAVSYSDNIIGVSTVNRRMTITHHNMTK